MKLLDDVNIKYATAQELIEALRTLIMHPEVVHVTDAQGNHVERLKLFSQKLTDGSVAQTLEIHFEA